MSYLTNSLDSDIKCGLYFDNQFIKSKEMFDCKLKYSIPIPFAVTEKKDFFLFLIKNNKAQRFKFGICV